MNSLPTQSSTTEYIGHVKNGVIVFDTQTSLSEGQAVRIEPLPTEQPTTNSEDLTERLNRMKALFAKWDEEDRFLTDEEAERLEKAMKENRGLMFRLI